LNHNVSLDNAGGGNNKLTVREDYKTYTLFLTVVIRGQNHTNSSLLKGH